MSKKRTHTQTKAVCLNVKILNVSINSMFPFLQPFLLWPMFFWAFRGLYVSFSCGFHRQEQPNPNVDSQLGTLMTWACRTDKGTEDKSSPFSSMHFYFSVVLYFVAQTYRPRGGYSYKTVDWHCSEGKEH